MDGFLEGIFNRNRVYHSKEGGNLIEVYRNGNSRTLKFNGVVYSRLNMDFLYIKEYWDFFLPLSFLWQNPRILMIGLGGGTIAFQLNKLLEGRAKIDIVEINKGMVDAMKVFLPEDLHLNIIIGDGFEYLKSCGCMYDLVILDAYIDSFVPDQFLESAFVDEVIGATSPDGVLALNYIGSASGPEKLKQYIESLKLHFKVYDVEGSPVTFNRIIVASKSFDKAEILRRVRAGMKIDKSNQFLIDGYDSMRSL